MARDHTLSLAEAVHGGPQLTANQHATWLAAHGLSCPLQVVAIQGLGARRLPAGWQAITLHSGLIYAFAPAAAASAALDRALRRHDGLRGEAISCARPGDLTQCIRLAILALRRHELADLSVDVSPEAERQLRRAAQDGMRRGTSGWHAALAGWLDLVFARHHQYAINHIRRRIIEFAASCTRPYPPKVAGLGWAVNRLMQRCSGTFVMGELRRVVEEDLIVIADCLQAEIAHEDSENELSPPVLAAWRHLRENFTDDLSVADLAQVGGVSEGHLARRFKQETGRTPLSAITELRLARARDLLLTSDQGILAIALASGFPSIEHFHRVFKRRHGSTPRRWRLEQRG